MVLSGLTRRAAYSNLALGVHSYALKGLHSALLGEVMSVMLLGDQIPSVPESFQRSLTAFDKDLYVVWHKSPHTKQAGRWKIERCIKHYGKGFDQSGRPLHDHTCSRTYILMCQDEDGVPLPLGEWVFEKLREMRSKWEALGGDTERGVRNAIAESDRLEQELEDKRKAARDEMIQYNHKDKRFQLNKLMNLIERHDMRPNR